jgi:hypothetical protein
MKRSIRLLPLSIVLAACITQSEAQAQAPLSVFAPEATTLPGYHTDVFATDAPLDISKPIESLSLRLELYGMNQLQANDQPTIFRTDVSPTDVPNDSHFLLNPTQFTVVSSFESGNLLEAEIVFTTSVVFPSPHPSLVQAVAFDGHENPDGTFGSLTGSGRYTDGSVFSFSLVYIPEPNALALAVMCASICICVRQRRSQV